MSFGKRPPRTTQREQLEPPRQPPPKLTSSGAARPLKTVAVVALLFLAANAVANAYLRNLGHQLDQHFGYVGYDQTTNLALLRTPLADGWELKSCKLSKPAVDEFKEQQYQAVGITNSDTDAERNTYETRFLQCVAEDEAELLCDPEMKKAFLADANAVAADMDFSDKYKINAAMTTGDGKFDEILRTLDDAHPDVISGPLKVQAEINMQSRERLLDALKTLAARGVIDTSDIGYFGRSEFRDAIANLAPLSSICVGHKGGDGQ